MNINQRLKEIGFTPNEIRIYLYVLERDASTPPQISKGLGMPRSNIHYILQNLVEKDVLKKRVKGGRFTYVPNDPSVTLQLTDRKRKILEEIVPDLQNLYKKSSNKPVVKFYEGVEEIVQIFEDIKLAKGKKLIAFASIKKLFDKMPENFQAKIQKAIKEKEIFFREVLTPDSKGSAEQARIMMSPYYEYKILSDKYSDFPTDILVWDDSLALITLSDPVFGVVLVSNHLADTYRTHFEIIWNSLSNYLN